MSESFPTLPSQERRNPDVTSGADDELDIDDVEPDEQAILYGKIRRDNATGGDWDLADAAIRADHSREGSS